MSTWVKWRSDAIEILNCIKSFTECTKSAQNLGVKWRQDALSQRSTRILEVILPNFLWGWQLNGVRTRSICRDFCLYTVSISGWRLLAGDGLEKREPRLGVAVISGFGRGSRGIDYPQNRLSFRLRLSSMTALSSASRFSCAGVVYHPPAPRTSQKAFNRRQKTRRRLAFHAKCFLTTTHCRYFSVTTNQKLSTTLATRKKNIQL